MKKRILALSMVLALVSVLIAPMAALAVVTDVKTGTDTGTKAPAPTITIVSPLTGAYTGSTLGITITGTDFVAVPSTIYFGEAGIVVTNIGRTSDTIVTCDIAIGAAVVTGIKTVTVTVLGQTATSTGTGTSMFTVLNYVTVTAPTGIALGTAGTGGVTFMTVGISNLGNSAGSVATNAAAWAVLAKDLKLTNPGYMTIADLSGPLIGKFLIGSTSSPAVESATGFTYTETTNSDKALPFFVSQAVASGDAAAAYTITITFTGTVD